MTGVLNGTSCFVVGTLVLTEDGEKPIEDIEVGDYVYSTDPETGESGFKEVLWTYQRETYELVHVFVADEEILTTPNHPFWVESEWITAGNLYAGDILTLADGSKAAICQIFTESLDNPVKVYNFEVEDFHTYYVTNIGVLVHNYQNEKNSFDDYESDEYYEKSVKPQKGKSFRGGSKKSRDKWYGIEDKDFRKWWEREGKREYGGMDIQDSKMAAEVYNDWIASGKPKSNGGKW